MLQTIGDTWASAMYDETQQVTYTSIAASSSSTNARDFFYHLAEIPLRYVTFFNYYSFFVSFPFLVGPVANDFFPHCISFLVSPQFHGTAPSLPLSLLSLPPSLPLSLPPSLPPSLSSSYLFSLSDSASRLRGLWLHVARVADPAHRQGELQRIHHLPPPPLLLLPLPLFLKCIVS